LQADGCLLCRCSLQAEDGDDGYSRIGNRAHAARCIPLLLKAERSG
jgi:hypothetical protein